MITSVHAWRSITSVCHNRVDADPFPFQEENTWIDNIYNGLWCLKAKPKAVIASHFHTRKKKDRERNRK